LVGGSSRNRTFTELCKSVTLIVVPQLDDIVDRTPMATRSFIADDKAAAADRVPASAGGILRYQLNVLASTTGDVVQSAGGWLYDRARAGWDVNVLVTGGGDPRPLAILGATAHDRDEGFLPMVRSASRVGALAVSADLLASDARLRDEVVRVLKHGLTEVTVWGKHWPDELGRQADSVQHRVSAAARAFKSYALVAADLSADAVTMTETLFRIETGSLRSLYSV
jgi:hypothetical protein